ncbi:MAG: acyl carrier protein [Candidatus Sedimenticola endophacoides]
MSAEVQGERYHVFLRGYVARRRGLAPDQVELDGNIFELNYCDSLGFFGMLLEIEDAFGVRFNEEDLADRRLLTLRGMAQLLAARAGPD